MTMAPVHSRFSRKTLAIALAASVSFGGVQIVGPEMGFNTVAEASAAELNPSVVTTTELVSDKSGQNVFGTTVEATEAAYTNFLNTHGNDFKLKLDFKIPDDAQPGDTFVIKKDGSIDPSIDGNIAAATKEGRKVGHLRVTYNRLVFVVSDQIANSINRTASFEIPYDLNVEPHHYKVETPDTQLDGMAVSARTLSFSTVPPSTLILNRVYEYKAPTVRMYGREEDKPDMLYFSRVDINKGIVDVDVTPSIGYANLHWATQEDGTYTLNPSAKTRDVTIRYTVDDPDGRIFAVKREPEMRLQVEKFSPTKVRFPHTGEPAVEGENFYLYVKDNNKTFNVTTKQINAQTMDITVHDVPPEYYVRMINDNIRVESPYSPGKKVTVTGTFIGGVGEPSSAYDRTYIETFSKSYTHPSFAGYGSADDIKRDVAMSAKVNGHDADNVNSAQQVKDGKAQFSIDLKNNGNIGAGSATVTYPKGVTGPNGETEKFIDFGAGGFPVGSTKTFDLGELNVPEGTNENKFTVTMSGYPELTDAAWTATGPTDIYVDKVERKGDTVTITRNDGEKFTFKVNDTNGIKDVVDNGDGSITIVRDNGNKEKVNLTHTTVTETNKGKPGHTITITTPDGKKIDFNAFDVYVTDIKKNADGNYDVYRSDVNGGKTVWKTIKLDDLRKEIKDLKGKDAEQDKRLDDLEKQIDDANKNLDDLTDKVNKNEGAIEDHRKTIGDILVKIGNIEGDIKNIQDELVRLDGQDIKEVRDNGDGTYTLIRNDGSEVLGDIDTSGNITNIVSDGKGNLIVTTVDGNTTTVPVDQVKITESNKGTPEHTVTITTPDGQSVTFNVFDVYVVDVEKQPDGNYKIIRNDGTEWVINLKDIRDKIAALEAKDSPSRDEFNVVKDEINNLEKEIDDLKAADEAIKGDITNIKNDITTINNRLITIEARLTVVENNTNNLTKCVAGAGMVGIPALLSIPLMMMTQLNIPGLKDLNNQVQKQIGMFNPELARQWKRNGGVLQAGAALATLAGIIGGIAYLAKQCDPMMQTPAGQDTDLGQLSSKLDEGSAKIKESSSTQKDADAENTEADAPEVNAPAENTEVEQPEAETPAEQPAE